jgi:ferritin-like metal-binding protein YciE
MASDKKLQELFHETLKDIYFAEKKILSALPKMAKAAQSKDLKAAFEKHETETEEHVDRLEKVFAEMDETPRGKTCDAIMGIIEEGQEVMKEFRGAPALDAGLLAAAQAVEHYEIARYGTLKTWAAELGLNQAVKLLETTLGEERRPHGKLDGEQYHDQSVQRLRCAQYGIGTGRSSDAGQRQWLRVP